MQATISPSDSVRDKYVIAQVARTGSSTAGEPSFRAQRGIWVAKHAFGENQALNCLAGRRSAPSVLSDAKTRFTLNWPISSCDRTNRYFKPDSSLRSE